MYYRQPVQFILVHPQSEFFQEQPVCNLHTLHLAEFSTVRLEQLLIVLLLTGSTFPPTQRRVTVTRSTGDREQGTPPTPSSLLASAQENKSDKYSLNIRKSLNQVYARSQSPLCNTDSSNKVYSDAKEKRQESVSFIYPH